MEDFVIREFDPERDRDGVDTVDRMCEVGPSGTLSIFTDLLGDPVSRIRHSPAYRMLVRMKLVKDWLPVLNVCRDIVSPMPSGHKMLYQELEETFLRIISTLPMPDAQELLQQCLCFSTRDVDDCPHLVEAFNTWFRRANRPPHDDDSTAN